MAHKVVAVAYDRLCTFEFGCAVEFFALPRPELTVPWYEFSVCAAERKTDKAARQEARTKLAPLRQAAKAHSIAKAQ